MGIIEWLLRTKEYGHLGLNMETAVTALVIGFGVLATLALGKQTRTIFDKRSGSGVSVTLYLYNIGFLAAAVIYGVRYQSFNLVLSCLVALLLSSLIIVGLFRYKAWTRIECAAIPLVSFMPLSMLYGWQMDVLYAAFSIGSSVALALQPWELWKQKTTGALDVEPLLVFLASNTVWSAYALMIGAAGLFAGSIVKVALLALTSSLWFRYRHAETRGS
jgi:uncharacterized protein with PQ loop repeat